MALAVVCYILIVVAAVFIVRGLVRYPREREYYYRDRRQAARHAFFI
jgi:hypothetical protein